VKEQWRRSVVIEAGIFEFSSPPRGPKPEEFLDVISRDTVDCGNKQADDPISFYFSRSKKLEAYAISLVVVSMILAAYMSWETAGIFFFANNAASVNVGTGTILYSEVDSRFETATNLAPEVSRYWHSRAGLENGLAESTTNAQTIHAARQRAYE
jgi:hypothetical protein